MKKKLMKELFAEETALLLYTHNCSRKMKSYVEVLKRSSCEGRKELAHDA